MYIAGLFSQILENLVNNKYANIDDLGVKMKNTYNC